MRRIQENGGSRIERTLIHSGAGLIATVCILFALTGCSGKSNPRNSTAPNKPVSPPTAGILCQPILEYDDGIRTPQGTGFMVWTSSGGPAAVTASHFINSNGPPLMRVAWTDVRDGSVIENLTNSWGPPGRGGVTQLKMMDIDLRTDYLVLPITATVASERTMELDERSMPESGERIWFPNKNPEASEGFDLLEGHLSETHIKYHVVILDSPVEISSQSGSPVISQVTGKVVGIISRDGREYGLNMLGENLSGRIFLLTPSATIARVFTSYSEHPSLSRVTGKRSVP